MAKTEAPLSGEYVKDERGCWLWLKSMTKNGYGQITVKGEHFLAHRYSYILHRGEIPEGLLVLHTCDVRRCINPDHLFLGTYKENSEDMVKKGRGYRQCGPEVVEFVMYYKKELKLSNREIGRRVGVHWDTIKYLLERAENEDG